MAEDAARGASRPRPLAVPTADDAPGEPLVLRGRADITLAAYREVAWRGRPVRLHAGALARIGECRRGFEALIESDEDLVVYGVTTGYGQMASVRLDREQRRRMAARGRSAAATSFGEPVPERLARGIVLARLANLVEGHAAVTPELAAAVAALLDGRPLPPVPALGNGCPGEIQALSHLFAGLVETRRLVEKEHLALVNGSPCAAALVADAALAARRRLALATEVLALSCEALKAPHEAWDEALDSLWEDAHQAAALADLRRLLAGGARERRAYQAPVSWRVLPRLLGQLRRAVARAEEVAALSLRAVSDNPVYVPPDERHPLGRVLSNGGYHNALAAPALDELAGSWADLATLCDRHADKLLDARVSLLPAYLMPDRQDPSAIGAYLGCLCMTAVAYAEQARHAAQRTLLPGSEGGGFGQNDLASPAFPAWRREGEAGRCLDANLAILAVVASQALFVTGRDAPPALAARLAAVREVFPPPAEPDAFGPPVERLCARFGDEVYDAG